jgi:Domain of unknown function (DUF4328)
MYSPGHVSQDGKWLWNGVQWVPLNADGVGAWPYESAHSRATYVTVALAANAVAGVLITTYTVLTVFTPGNFNTQPPPLEMLAIVSATGLAVTFVPAVVFYCLWLHRAVQNMPALGSPDPSWSPGGAVGRCFVPILNFVHPLFSVLDAWRGADPSRRWLNTAERRAIHAPKLIVAWWVLWLAGSWGGNPFDLTGMAAVIVDLLKGAAYIGAAWLGILMVRQLTARQDRKNELINTGQLA